MPSGAAACNGALVASYSMPCADVDFQCGPAATCTSPADCLSCVDRCTPTPCNDDADCARLLAGKCVDVEWRCVPYISSTGCYAATPGSPECGNGSCEPAGDETCSTCPADCGYCAGATPLGVPCKKDGDCASGQCFHGLFCTTPCSDVGWQCVDNLGGPPTGCVAPDPSDASVFLCAPECGDCAKYPGTSCVDAPNATNGTQPACVLPGGAGGSGSGGSSGTGGSGAAAGTTGTAGGAGASGCDTAHPFSCVSTNTCWKQPVDCASVTMCGAKAVACTPDRSAAGDEVDCTYGACVATPASCAADPAHPQYCPANHGAYPSCYTAGTVCSTVVYCVGVGPRGCSSATETVDCGSDHCVTPIATESTDATCNNGKDDEANGHFDCKDFHCSANPSVTVCAGESDGDACSNHQDDDGDGLVDCADPDCQISPAVTSCGAERGDAECHDGLDNDGDGKIDCADLSCAASPFTTCP